MVVGGFGRADPFGSADRAEFGEGLIEFARTRSSWQEEIELLSSEGYALAGKGDPVDCCCRGAGFERQTQQSEQHAFVLTGRGHADPPMSSRTAFELQVEVQFRAAQGTEHEALGQARDQSTEHEGEGLEAFDRSFEVEAFFEGMDSRLGQRRFLLLSTRPSDQGEEVWSQTCCEVAPRQAQQVADAMDTEAGERLGTSVVGIEQVDGKGREEGELVFGEEDPGGFGWVGFRMRRVRV